jgi:hypothetical protein
MAKFLFSCVNPALHELELVFKSRAGKALRQLFWCINLILLVLIKIARIKALQSAA